MSNRSRKAAGRAGKLAVAAGAVFLTTRHGWADTIWQAGTDTWFNDANWSGDQPTSTSTADINNSGTADIASGLASTNVLNLGQAAGQSGSVAITGGTLSVATVEEPGVLVGGYEYIGLSGTGSFIQSGGFNDNSSGRGIYLGENAGSTGEYSLCNGGVLAGSLFVGDSGAGIFNQVDGICTVYSLYVGHEGGSTGTYTLQSGILSAYVTSLSACNEYIGYAGGSNGTFIQNGGANLLLGAFTELYVEGTYLLNNGELADSTTEFIDGGGASLIQSGGVNTVGTLAVGGQISGTYALQAGTLTAGVINLGVVISPDPLLYGTGDFTQTGGTLSFETFNQGGGIVTLSPLVLSNGMAYNLNFGTLTTPSITISTGGTLTMSQGTLNAVIINVEAGGTFVEAGAISCTSLNQTGGTVNWDSVNISGTDVPMYEFTNVPNYNYSSGLFTVNTEYVGTDNVAEYTQTMGVNDPVELNIGYNPGETGTYVLTGSGTLEATETVGFQGVGTLNQTGGTNLAANLSIGTNGAYLLSGGVLNAGVINSSGVFNQTGGSLSFGTFNQNGGNLSFGALTLQGGGPDINFMLNGGTLNCPTITVNSGGTFAVGRGTLLCTTLNQSGGLVSFNSASISGANTPIYDFAGIQNYNFSGGTFAVGTEYVGFGGTASYSQSVNQNDPGTLTLGYGKSDSGTYTLTANGQLSAVEFIGYSGNGLFNQSGGSNYSGTGSFYLGYNAGSTGTYILSGTAYFNPSEVYVGDNGVGVFNQTGGTNATVPILGANSGATGTYILSGGVLQQTVEVGAGGVGVFNQSGGI
ncbi:MAG TPA: hypothetical protein VL992_08850, partial [Tepidisphaeraceae bacterium]|nr:hypothetical protein [Tepidisphaeraceae bacterium]